MRGGRVALIAVVLAMTFPAVGFAQTKSTDFVEVRQLSLELANEIAWSALKACRRQDAQIAVAVVDRGGRTQVLLRDALAGPQ